MWSDVPERVSEDQRHRGRAETLGQRPEGAERGEIDESFAEHYARLSRESQPHRRVDGVLRTLDLGIAAVAVVVLSPLLLLVALALLVTSGRPLLYRGARVGRHGRVFTMVKFRTLARDAEKRLGGRYGPELTRLTEAETTAVGRWLRASQLDEIPQLWNVVVGDMSIVGPRPIRPAFFADLARDIPQYWQRLVVRPGLTGFAQMRMTREESWEQKLAHDLEYIADRSVGLYVRMIAATFWRVLRQSVRAVFSMLRSVVSQSGASRL
jgi:lipopolysaccharide/colanic/teichoic acid biosynthesis glycosyltransferase